MCFHGNTEASDQGSASTRFTWKHNDGRQDSNALHIGAALCSWKCKDAWIFALRSSGTPTKQTTTMLAAAAASHAPFNGCNLGPGTRSNGTKACPRLRRAPNATHENSMQHLRTPRSTRELHAAPGQCKNNPWRVCSQVGTLTWKYIATPGNTTSIFRRRMEFSGAPLKLQLRRNLGQV